MMRMLFKYFLYEEYEGDEGVMLPTLGVVDSKSISQQERFKNHIDGSDDFLFFISNLDTVDKISDVLQKIRAFLNNESEHDIVINDSYGRKAKLNKDKTLFDVNNLTGEPIYRGAIPTVLFFNILEQWKSYVISGDMNDVVVDVSELAKS